MTLVPRHPTYRLITLTFFFAGLTHLWLADAWQDSWIPGNLFFGAGLLLLLIRPGALAWALCAVGKLLPLLFARDHLVQSLLLLLFSSSGALLVGLHAYASTWPARFQTYRTEYGEISRYLWAFFDLLRLLTIATYGLATLHKLNRDFFNPEVSCATHGINRLLQYYGIAPISLGPEGLALALFVIFLEGSIALLYLLGARRQALIAALIFHIPLTLTMAPAFAFVMLIGHAAFLRPVDLRVFRAFLRRRGLLGALLATAITAVSVFFAQQLQDWTMVPREFLLWFLLFLAFFARPYVPRLNPAPGQTLPTSSPLRGPRLLVRLLALAFLLQGLTPYLGVKFQHTGAMVSNLRIDEGCWNSLIFPESFRIEDRYIRIDQGYFGAPGRIPRYEAILTDQLWNGTMVRQMQKNWCRPNTRPFYIAGTYRDRSFEIADLCAEDLPWPFADDGIFGVELFPEAILFQRNLLRECPQRCMH